MANYSSQNIAKRLIVDTYLHKNIWDNVSKDFWFAVLEDSIYALLIYNSKILPHKRCSTKAIK
jgi:hypothetical protein